jgi:hypothetical protein
VTGSPPSSPSPRARLLPTRPGHEVERGARWDERLALDTLLELLHQTPEVRERPGMEVNVVVRFAFLRIREQIDDMRGGERQHRVGKVLLLNHYHLEVLPLDPVHLLTVPIDESLSVRFLLLSKEVCTLPIHGAKMETKLGDTFRLI